MIKKVCPHEASLPVSYRHEPVDHIPGAKFCWQCGGKLVNEFAPTPRATDD